MNKIGCRWKDGLVAAYDMIQSHENGEDAGYKAAYYALHNTGEIGGNQFREGWADALENWKYIEEVNYE